MRAIWTWGLALCVAVLPFTLGRADSLQEIRIGLLRLPNTTETISILDTPAADDGLAGGKLAVNDNNTTGKFMNQHFTLDDVKLTAADDPVAAAQRLVEGGATLIITALPAKPLLAVADALRGRDVTLFNASAPDEDLREDRCRADVIHIAPSRTMLADALAEYLVWKRWTRWFLMVGSHPEDRALGDAYRRAARKFGAKIVEDRTFEDTGGGRRSDSGSVQTQAQIPVATQSVPSYDVLVAADESEVFANDLPYRTWDARPVVGSAGLVPTSWDPSQEQWGAAQIESRFQRLNNRRMSTLDMNVWTAVRMVGEAATRTKSTDPRSLHAFLVGPDMSVAAFKGQKLTLRDWNQQLRQPILLSDGHTVVSVSPQNGFLHQTSTLDTLGLDRPETKCKLQ